MIDPMAPLVAFVIGMGIAYFIEWYSGGPRGPRGV